MQLAFIGRTQAGAMVRVEVAQGVSLNVLMDELKAKQLITRPIWYRMYGLMDEKVSHPRAGSYLVQPGASMRALARTLALGPQREEVQVRIIEGWNIGDITRYLSQERAIDPNETAKIVGKVGNDAPFEKDLRTQFPFLAKLDASRSLEGYLFPDTYRVWGEQLPEGLVLKQLQEFQQLFGDVQVTSKSAPLKNLDQVVILASIVEREVRSPEEMRMVAGIFLRRLREGIPLQSDATLGYITGSKRGRMTADELASENLYNSYQHQGLPPGPISNPGKSAIQAVLDPAPSNYRYFLTDEAGKIYYAATLEEHVANKRKAGY